MKNSLLQRGYYPFASVLFILAAYVVLSLAFLQYAFAEDRLVLSEDSYNGEYLGDLDYRDYSREEVDRPRLPKKDQDKEFIINSSNEPIYEIHYDY